MLMSSQTGFVGPSAISMCLIYLFPRRSLDRALATDTWYWALIKSGSNGVKDLAGNSLAQDYSWRYIPCDGGIVLSASNDVIAQGPVVCG